MENLETRYWRKQAHASFDPLWQKSFKKKSNRRLNRDHYYNLVSNKFGYRVHIGESNVEQCQAIIKWCEKRKGK